MKTVIRHLDQVLPVLTLNDPTFIKIEIEDDVVRLWVGPRDWEWKNGTLVGCGTGICTTEDP